MRKKLIAPLLLLLSLATFAFPRVYPSVVSMDIKSGRGRTELTVFNTENEIKKYKINIRDVDNFGQPSEFAKYLKVFPKYIEIKPGEQQIVRVFAKEIPVSEFPIGEVRASLAIEEIKDENAKKYKSKSEDNGVSTMIAFEYVLNMAVYGYNGKLIPKVDVLDIKKDKGNVLTGKIINKGNYSYPLIYEILDANNKVVGNGSLGKIIADHNLDFKVPLEENSYTFVIKEKTNNSILYTSKI